jgi:hypothetical protein
MIIKHKITLFLLLGSLAGSGLAMHKENYYEKKDPSYYSSSYAADDSEEGCCDNIKQRWSNASLPMRALTIGISLVAISGFTALIYHLITREESNSKLYMHSQSAYEEILHKYRFGVALLQTKQLALIDSETELASLTSRISQLNFGSLDKDIKTLQEKRDRLQKRVSRDAHKGDPLIGQMVKILQDIKKLISDLTQLDEFWQRHGDYFVAYSRIDELSTRYKQARASLHDINQIKKIVMANAVGGWSSYPYLSFADNLKSDTDRLERSLHAIRRYATLRGLGLILQEELQKILGNVVACSEYANELYLKKQHQLEQERIAIERQKAEAERAKAEAMAAHAAAEREKANAMYQQAAAARENAQAIKDQTLVHLVQPKPQISINLQPPAQATSSIVVPTAPAYPSTTWSNAAPVINSQNGVYVPPAPSAPPVEEDAPPSYNATMFFRAIENITPDALARFDFHINQLERQYGLARDTFIDNASLIGAALDAKNLDAYNKAQLIDLLKRYGVEPTWADIQKAREIGESLILKAVGA